MMTSATALSRQDVTARSISWWIALGLACAVLNLAMGSAAAEAPSPPISRSPSPVKLSSLPPSAGAKSPLPTVREPPPKPQSPSKSPPPKSPPPKSPPPKSPPRRSPPRRSPPPRSPPPRSPPPRSPPPRSPPPRLPPPSPPRKSPPLPRLIFPPPSPAAHLLRSPPTPSSLSDSCSFCAEVTVTVPTGINMVPATCTDMAKYVLYDIWGLYSVRNTGSVRISCSPDFRQITVCTSVRTTALSQVPQADLDERVLSWTQVILSYMEDYCQPIVVISSIITSTDGCLLSDQSNAYSCDIWPAVHPS
ncbi:hypothetical protein Vretimale_17410 [Volvox reticuliferus]|uniref:Pherophorin domain-containing protein n=1 Tax=Volvox reticuliferus TaxID=1737510 RepID=A0A8J4FLP0_9CHLO|nr:hypothetical protein Vretifemale_9430 [Volvox reticuliferus]GIL80262.1 hypothetical protein Vretifemale_9430 [Volvox reticuliferus]GIM14510.1 hypothetical protein Vretimale_17410 [Volvox reticuliferus]GIM14512.1 hypothetical protein Vretimale_17410 [Volvox reticuliferus]